MYGKNHLNINQLHMNTQKSVNMYCIPHIFALIAIVTQIQAHTFNGRSSPGKSKIFKVACHEDADCSLLFGGEGNCVDNICVCTNLNGCKETYSIIENKCETNESCATYNAFCSNGTCQCEENYISSFDKKNCLKKSGGLQQRCEEDVQCLANVEHSKCGSKNLCICDEDYHKNKFICSLKVKLGESCSIDGECSYISFSKCGNKFLCECVKGYIPSENKTKCLAIANKENPECVEVEQCRELYSHGALCLHNRCECDQMHRFVNTTMNCPTRLHRPCTTNDECRNGSDDMSIECKDGICACSPTFTETDSFCNGVANYHPTLVIISTMMIFITLFV